MPPPYTQGVDTSLPALMKQMEALHAPAPPPRKPKMSGILIKAGQKRPKGSINVPPTGLLDRMM